MNNFNKIARLNYSWILLFLSLICFNTLSFIVPGQLALASQTEWKDFLTNLPSVYDDPSLAEYSSQEIERRLQKFHYSSPFTVTSFELITDYQGRKYYEGELSTNESVEFPALKILFHYYEPESTGPHPVMLSFPTANGKIPMEGSIGRFLNNQDISFLTLVSDGELTNPMNRVEDLDVILARSTVKILYLLDWLQTRPEIDDKKIGLLGLSLGGILSAIVMGIDTRPQAALLVVAGGNLPEIITYGQDPATKIFRNSILERYGLETDQDFLRTMRENIKLDPLVFTSRRTAEDFYFIMAKKDTFVPPKNQRELWEAFGRPQSRTLPFGHITSAIASVLFTPEYLQFFNDRWEK